MNCLQGKWDCQFSREGRCEILRDTHFTRPCPFYKKGSIDVLLERTFPNRPWTFREIKGSGGRYFVSEFGEVVSSKGRVLKRKYDQRGRAYVTYVTAAGRSTTRSVAVLVADAFLPGAGAVVLKDGDPDNCEVWNLERVENGKQNF